MVKGVKLLSLSLLMVALFTGVTTQRVERNISVVVAGQDGPPPT